MVVTPVHPTGTVRPARAWLLRVRTTLGAYLTHLSAYAAISFYFYIEPTFGKHVKPAYALSREGYAVRAQCAVSKLHHEPRVVCIPLALRGLGHPTQAQECYQ